MEAGSGCAGDVALFSRQLTVTVITDRILRPMLEDHSFQYVKTGGAVGAVVLCSIDGQIAE